MDRDKIFPTDLLLITQVISSGVVQIAWHRKVYRKTITTKYSLNNWGIRSQFSSHTLYLQTSRVLSFSIKCDLRLILAGKRTQRPLARFLVTCLSKDDGKRNDNKSREQ